MISVWFLTLNNNSFASMIIPFSIPQRQRSGIGVMASIKSLLQGDMSMLSPESKITGNQPLSPVRSSLIYVPMPPTNDTFYEAAVGQLDAEGGSLEGNSQYM